MFDSTQVLPARHGRLLVAPYGTSRPEDVTDLSSLDAAFVDVGYTGDEDVTFNRGIEREMKRAWQSHVPYAAIVTDENPRIVVPSLEQWSAHNLLLALGGGEIVDVDGGFSYVREPGTIAELTVLLRFARGEAIYCLGLKRCVVVESPDVKLTRKDRSPLPVTFAGLVPEDEYDAAADPDPWIWFTDDPAFETVS